MNPITLIVLNILLIAISAAFNAVCDTLENQVSFNASVFYKKDISFWCKEISWNKAKRIFGYKIDAWHLFKSGWICLLLLAILLNVWFSSKPQNFNWLFGVWYVLAGVLWNSVFTLFYHKLLKRNYGN